MIRGRYSWQIIKKELEGKEKGGNLDGGGQGSPSRFNRSCRACQNLRPLTAALPPAKVPSQTLSWRTRLSASDGQEEVARKCKNPVY